MPGFPDLTYLFILPLLQKIAELTNSYGWAIIVLTVGFRLLVSPLVAQTTISMRKMSKLQPQMKAIQERYKDDPEQAQKKLVEFYTQNKVNPFGGCLPTLLQLPILFALYAAFAGPPFTDKPIDVKINVVQSGKGVNLSKEESTGNSSIYLSKNGTPAKVVVYPGNSTIESGSEISFGTRAIEGKLPADFTPEWRITLPNNHQVINAIDPTKEAGSNSNTKEAFIDTTGHAYFPAPGEYHVQGIVPGIAKGEPFAFISGLGKVATGTSLLNPANFDILFLIAMFGISMFISQKLTVPPPKPADGKELDEQQIIQQQTMKTMPIVTTMMFFFFPIPAGVYLYLVISNIIQTLQTWLIAKRFSEPEIEDTEKKIIEIGSKAKNVESGAVSDENKTVATGPITRLSNGNGNRTKQNGSKKKAKKKK